MTHLYPCLVHVYLVAGMAEAEREYHEAIIIVESRFNLDLHPLRESRDTHQLLFSTAARDMGRIVGLRLLF